MTTALYRRYRPDSFQNVIGQDHVTEPLRAALRSNRITHAYLFSGPRGCGKTTSARILARCLNCEQGPTDTPCGECASCRELATGGPGSLDVVEIDAASHGGVDDARDLRERATFAPVRDRFKIFIIDEAHMVTPQAFNALLKVVEEPPEHVKFVFATTEPDKVLGTIRSRTHHYPFRLVPPDSLEPYLAHLCEEEHVEVAPGVLGLVIRAGGGSVRDSLSVLDQLMAGTVDGALSYERAVALLGYTDAALLDETVDALAGGDGAAVYRVVERMVESGHDPRRFVEDLLQRLRDLLIISVAGDGAADALGSVPPELLGRMRLQARNWGPAQLTRAADLTDRALRQMVGATSPRLQLELLIGRILVPAAPAPAVQGAVPGTVGMAGGGAPRGGASTMAEGAGGPVAGQAGGRRYGAAEAKADLARRQRERGRVAGEQSAVEPVAAPAQPVAPQVSAAPVSGPAVEGGPVVDATRGASPQAAAPGTQAWPTVAPVGAGASGTAVSPGEAGSPAPQVDPAPTPVDGSGANAGVTRAPAGESIQPGAHAEESERPAPVAQPEPARQVPVAYSSAPDAGPSASGAGEDGMSGRHADMLRSMWGDVVERLKSISRVSWHLLHDNAQLGSVAGTDVVVLLPTPGLVQQFATRTADVERAIHEAVGLTVRVRGEVAPAGGGAEAPTATSPVSDRPSGPGQALRGAEGEAPDFGVPFLSDGRSAGEDRPPVSGEWPEPVASPGGRRSAFDDAAPADWDAPFGEAPADAPDVTTPTGSAPSPAPATAPTEDRSAPAVPAAPAPTDRTPEVAPPDVAVPEVGATDWPEVAVPAPAGPSTDLPAVENGATPGWDDPAPDDAPAPLDEPPARSEHADVPPEVPAEVAASPVTAEDLTPPTTEPGGWTEAVAVPGGGGLTFDDPGVAPPEGAPGAAWEPATSTHAAAPEASAGGAPAADQPLTGRERLAARLQARSEAGASAGDPGETAGLGGYGVPASAGPHVAASEDDTASLDDDDLDVTAAGIPAVLEILGGTIIDEKTLGERR